MIWEHGPLKPLLRNLCGKAFPQHARTLKASNLIAGSNRPRLLHSSPVAQDRWCQKPDRKGGPHPPSVVLAQTVALAYARASDTLSRPPLAL